MSKDKEKTKDKKSGVILFIIIFFLMIALIASAFAIYEILLLESIEDTLRYIVIGVLGFLDLIFILMTKSHIKGKKKRKKKGFFIFSLFLYLLICLGIGGVIYYVYGQLNSLNKETVIYTSDLLTMSSNEANTVEDVSNMKIGLLKDKKSPEGYIIPREIIKEHALEDDNEIVEYDDYTSMLVDMYANELDAMFISDHYVSMFSGITGYENIATDTKVIIKKDKKMKKSKVSSVETASASKPITEPFTILLMGIDSTDEVLSKNAIANGDTLILRSSSAEIGRVEEKMKIKKNNNEDIKISFSAKYMMEALKSFSTENVELNFVGEIKPILI